MPSIVDISRFIDGAPVAKADLRRSFTAVRDELEHGGFYRAQGVGAVERTVADRLNDTVNLLDFIPVAEHGAISNFTSTFDCSTALRNALATGRNIAAPAGLYVFTRSQTLGGGERRSFNTSQVLMGESNRSLAGARERCTVFCYNGEGAAFRISGSQSGITSCHITGVDRRDLGRLNPRLVGDVGVLVGITEQVRLDDLTISLFGTAGLVLAGSQNSLISRVLCKFNRWNFVATSMVRDGGGPGETWGTRNIWFLGCNSSDWVTPERTAWYPDALWKLRPGLRAIHVGPLPELEKVVRQGAALEARASGPNVLPTNLFFYGGIHERFDNQSYAVELDRWHGNITFMNCEFTRSGAVGPLPGGVPPITESALIKINAFDTGGADFGNHTQQLILIAPQFIQKEGQGRKLVINRSSSPVHLIASDARWAVDGPSNAVRGDQDHYLSAPTSFFHGVGRWGPSHGGKNGEIARHHNRRLLVVFPGGEFGARCGALGAIRGWRGFETGQILRLTVLATTLAGESVADGSMVEIVGIVNGPPWTVPIGRLGARDLGRETVLYWDGVGPRPATGEIGIRAVLDARAGPEGTVAAAEPDRVTLRLPPGFVTTLLVGRALRIGAGQDEQVGIIVDATAAEPGIVVVSLDEPLARSPRVGSSCKLHTSLQLARFAVELACG